MSRLRTTALALAWALAAPASGLAAEPTSADAPIVAAPTAPGPSTAEQIDAFLKTSPAVELPRDAAPGVTPAGDEPRQMHGEIDVAVGTGGYRSAYVRTDIPVGKTGTVSIAVGQSRVDGARFDGGRVDGGRFGPYQRQSLGLGFALGETAADSGGLPCRRRSWDGGAPRPDEVDLAAGQRPCARDGLLPAAP